MKKKSVAKAKVFFLLIHSAPFPRPRHPPLSFHSSLLQFDIHNHSNGFGGFASQWLQAPNQSNLGRKSWTWSSWGKKSIFPWKSHAVQLARVSPLLETPSLTSSHPSPGRRFQRNTIGSIYESKGGLGGRRLGQRSLRAIRLFFFPGMFPSTCPFPGGHPPLPRKWQVSFH